MTATDLLEREALDYPDPNRYWAEMRTTFTSTRCADASEMRSDAHHRLRQPHDILVEVAEGLERLHANTR